MRLQKCLTIAMIVVTAVYVYLTFDQSTSTRRAHSRPADHRGDRRHGAGDDRVRRGLGQRRRPTTRATCPAPPRTRGVVWWPTFGGSLPGRPGRRTASCWPASHETVSRRDRRDPIGALTTILPTWFLLPFAIVAVGGLVSGAMMDIYSSGLTLLTLGLPTPRWVAAGIDGVLMVLGAIYIVWISDSDFICRLRGRS